MSITLTISRSGLKLSRHRATIESSELENGKPDVASLEDFASKVRFFQRRQRKAPDTVGTQHVGEAPVSNATPQRQAIAKDDESSRLEEAVPSASSPPLDTPPDGSSTLGTATSAPRVPPSQLAGINPLMTNVDSNNDAVNEGDTITESFLSPRTPSGTATTVASSTTGSESVHTDLTKPDSAQGEDVGGCSSAQQTTNEDQTKPDAAVAQHAIQTSTPASGSPSISSKGKETVRSSRWKPTKIHIPRGKLDLLRKIRIAGPETIKIEDAVFSAVHREKLRKFLGVLGSKKDQIELFGKELPLCRAYLVQVIEGTADPAPYICIQGLKNAADITRIHSAMSHKRYRALYDPLRLCYETSDLSHIGNPESPETPQSSSHTTSRGGSSLPVGFLSPIPEFPSQLLPDTGLQTCYEYLPVADDRTYCGALSRTFANGKISLSTFGGLVEVDGTTCLMTCQHGFSELSTSTIPSLSDTLAESDVPPKVEGPLVFCSRDIYNDPGNLSHDVSEEETRLASLGTFGETGWKSLSIGGAIRKGREWCLVPMPGHSILPNFIERPNSKKGKSTSEPEIFYLDQVAEPEPGHVTYISYADCSGFISGNTSFLFGGGTEGALEVWTVVMEGEKGLQKGDSGSWVLDTSDPLQYKVVGSAIAMSDGAAHFVRLQDQFFEMIGDTMNSSQVSLTPVFRSLAQCANMAYGLGDFLSADWFIEQALSRRALEQMHNGWYLPTIKAILGIINSDGNTTSRENAPPRPIAESLGNILLRYGGEILDTTVLSREWLVRHDSELQGGEKQILGKLVAAIESLDKGNSRSPNRLPNILPRYDSKPLPPIPEESKQQHFRSAARAHTRQSDGGRAFGLLVDKKTSLIPPITLLHVPFMVLFASISGIPAAMILRNIERGNPNSFFHIGIAKAASVGAAFGVISVSPMALHILLLYISRRFNWYLYLGGHEFSSSIPHRTNFGTAVSAICEFVGKVLLVIALSLARSTLTALYLARSLDVADTHPLVVASIAAAAPLIVSTALPALFWDVVPTRVLPVVVDRSLIPGWWLTATGFDALAGYTYGKVIQNQGVDIIQPQSSAASFGVFGALTILWFFLPFIVLGALDHKRARSRKQSHYVHELAADDHRPAAIGHPVKTKEPTAPRPSSDNTVKMTPALGSSSIAPSSSPWAGSTLYRPTPSPWDGSMTGSTLYRPTPTPVNDSHLSPPLPVYDWSASFPNFPVYYDDLEYRFYDVDRVGIPVELSTEPPVHQPPEIPRLKITPQPLPPDPSVQGLAKWLQDEPNYYMASRQGEGYPSRDLNE
ncbi:hypothetical protein O1611_g198 [Lasiodiplodia mahajangana]|uniref:Uncharacterized protein n=1 Tax=Lasiodiplodia mahajangana TaxID=1108764 RepID=A0ACC2K1J2_9PEZI|nr:hypothetical protein O1611_g198 [Lasiodiplodia mahajangana]